MVRNCISLSTFLIVLVLVHSGWGSILDKEEFEQGSTLKITCRVSTLEDVPLQFNTFTRVTVSRDVTQSGQFELLAQNQLGISGDLQSEKPPFGREGDFQFNFLGAVSENNRNTFGIEIIISRVRCEDSGLYKCEMLPQDPDIITDPFSKTENATGVVPAGDISLVPEGGLSIGNDPTVQYYLNDTVTIECNILGPLQSDNRPNSLAWYKMCPDDFLSNWAVWFPYNDVKPQDPVQQGGATGRCTRFQFSSTLKFQMSADMDGCMVQCAFGRAQSPQNVVKMRTGNYTIELFGSATSDPVRGGGGGSSDDIGVIIGPIVGVLAVLIIVALLVYFCWYRKRDKGDKYKEEERADANNADLHAPPPVFYSKPPKEEKENTVTGMTNEGMDNSFDSKDSANRGPPRYANNFEPDNGPPYYERESTQRGRNNQGYDEERSQPARRYRPRERSNRSDEDQERERARDYHNRSRDYDDEPRSRDYSMDDGTDTKGYGNSHLGTAI